MSTLFLFCDDKYGVRFYECLVQRMKDVRLLKKEIKLKIQHLVANCNPKFSRLLLSLENSREIIGLAVIMDKEMKDDNVDLAKFHLKSCRIKHSLFYFETEIEELLF